MPPKSKHQKLEQLEHLFKAVNQPYATHEEVKSLLDALLKAVREYKQALSSENTAADSKLQKKLGDFIRNIEIQQFALEKKLSGAQKEPLKRVKELEKQIEKDIERVYDAIPDIRGVQERIEEVAALIPEVPEAQEPPTPEEVRDALQTLEDEDRLDASAIKNLPKTIEEYTSVGIHGPLWGLQDVDVVDIAIGQSIKWTGVRWIPYTPAGTGTTSVYNEVVDGSGTSWTLDNEPEAGTLRVYANGQRLALTTDYTITGTTLTTVLSWSAGTILADYEYA